MQIHKVVDSFKFILCAALLSGCASWGGEVGEIPQARPETGGAIDSQGALDGLTLRNTILGEGPDVNNLPVNKYLWRASLEVLNFLPLDSIDTFSGVISTDWGSAPGATDERVRVTSFVKGKELSASELDVTVFRETLTPAGVWRTAEVSPETASKLEDAILTRARQLRIDDIDS